MKRDALLCVLISIVLFAGCSKEQADLSDWNSHCDILSSAGRLCDSLVSLGDTTRAIDSVVRYLAVQPGVASAVDNGSNGISVTYSDSSVGIILVRLGGTRSTQEESRARNASPSINMAGARPSKNAARFYAPSYAELEKWESQTYQAMVENLPKVGFPSPIPAYLNQQVTLETLSCIPACGALHLDGHGAPHPSESDLREVYFCTTQPRNVETDRRFAGDIGSKPLDIAPVWFTGDVGSLCYAIAPSFLRRHIGNQWREAGPLVYGGFCYSARGTWQASMESLGTSAYLGWSSTVGCGMNSDWACSLYTFMCDTPCHEPYTSTVSGFMWKYIYYYWHTGQTGAMLQISGDPSTTFQQPVPEGWYVDGRSAVFGFAGANMLLDGELDISFGADSSIPPHFPIAAITIYDGSAVAPGSMVWPDDFGICFSETDVYGSEPWMPAPLYVYFTEATFTPPLGKVSGLIEGSVFRIGDTLPLPIYGSFSNVTVNVLAGPDAARAGRAAVTAAIHNVSTRTDAASATARSRR